MNISRGYLVQFYSPNRPINHIPLKFIAAYFSHRTDQSTFPPSIKLKSTYCPQLAELGVTEGGERLAGREQVICLIDNLLEVYVTAYCVGIYKKQQGTGEIFNDGSNSL